MNEYLLSFLRFKMSKKILFSVISRVDPIATNTISDGNLIYACRKLKPDFVYVYVSIQMEEGEIDKRCEFVLNKLKASMDCNFNFKFLRESKYCSKTEIHLFDEIYKRFSNIFSYEIKDRPKDDLYLVLSGGTPQVTSALCFLCATNKLCFKNVVPIQVFTPSNNQNTFGKSRFYPIDTLWRMDLDNNKFLENTRKPIAYPKLRFS